MKKGFEILNYRKGENDRIIQYETKYQFILPPIYRTFLQIFDTGEEKLKIDRYLDEDGDMISLGSICFIMNQEKIYLQQFLSIEDIFEQWENSKQEIEWTEKKLLRIGLLGQAGFGGLYVGCDSNNNDEIWNFNADSMVKFVKLANNIYEFISFLEFSYDFSNLEMDRYDQISKKWGEDFWRLSDK